jgi:ABC-type polysaccharide/polyol phosphate export permease
VAAHAATQCNRCTNTLDNSFVLRTLILKDFKIRYRNMSLGVFWSVLNPLIMMAVLTFVFTRLNKAPDVPGLSPSDFPLFFLCGLIPFNFLSVTWSTGTNCVVDNAVLLKRTLMPREAVPVASVLAAGLHLLIQIGLLIAIALWNGHWPTLLWLWIPALWAITLVFVIGLVLACSALDVFIRDMRYLVDSSVGLLFWFMPIFYSSNIIAARHKPWWELNPFTVLILSQRNVLINAVQPDMRLVGKMCIVSLVTLVIGWIIFRWLEPKFYDQL